jgi:hypothetical protein
VVARHRHPSLAERPDRSCAGVIDAHVDAARLQTPHPVERVVMSPGSRVQGVPLTGRCGRDRHKDRGDCQRGCSANSSRGPSNDPHVLAEGSSRRL